MNCMDNAYKYMVAARCFTYNHVHYIEDTLKGFVLQETTFPSVYIIIDDASTDGEQEFLKNWAEKYLSQDVECLDWKAESYGRVLESRLTNNPNSLFVIILLYENLFQKGKGYLKFDYIAKWLNDSKYLAICEGDDYWVDRNKLQKQVDYLESNDSVNIYVHNADKYICSTDETVLFNTSIPTKIYGIKDVIKMKWFTPTASFVYKNNVEVSTLWRENGCNGDMALLYTNLLKGDLFYDSTIMSVYRYGTPLSMSSASNKDILMKKKINLYKTLNKITHNKYIVYTWFEMLKIRLKKLPIMVTLCRMKSKLQK